MNLLQCTTDLGASYKRWKIEEKAKNDDKEEFFALATEACISRGLRTQWVLIDLNEEAPSTTVEHVIAREHPLWEIEERPLGTLDGTYHVVLTENPDLKAFTYVNVDDGMVYSRQISQGSLMLDDERVQLVDPALWEEIIYELPWGAVTVRPIETLPAEIVARLQKYMYTGKPTVKLAAPRKAKPEELEEVVSE